MNKINCLLLVMLCTCFAAAAQKNKTRQTDTLDQNEWRVLDSTDADNIPIAQEGLLLDTSLTADELLTPEEDSGEEESDLERRIRDGLVYHEQWDKQPIGQWDEVAQIRLRRRTADSGKLDELRKMKALQYAAAKPKSPENENWLTAFAQWMDRHGKTLEYVFYITLGLLLIMALILFIRKNDLPIFRRSYRKVSVNAGPLADTGPVDYETQAQLAIAAGNFRNAVRMRYLHTLQMLEGKNLIVPGKDKTNSDFLRDLARTAYHKPFATLTLHYEYIWYGQLPVNTGQFTTLDEQFAAFKQSIQHA